MSARRVRAVPGLPTVAAAGLPGYESMQIYGAFAPAGVPAPILKHLNEGIVRALGRAE